MKIEENLFKRYIVDFSKLEKFGFIKEKDYYIYSKNFMNNEFKTIIKIDNNGFIKGYVIDLNTNLEYFNIRLEKYGSWTGEVIDNYKMILVDIRDNCFSERYFISDQANRIGNYIIEKYHDKPEFLWKKYPNFGVFRNKNKQKWYALMANIKGNVFNKPNEEIEIINIKLNNVKIEKLLKQNGYYQAYHMNKKSWISIILDETLSDLEIEELIDESYKIVNSK